MDVFLFLLDRRQAGFSYLELIEREVMTLTNPGLFCHFPVGNKRGIEMSTFRQQEIRTFVSKLLPCFLFCSLGVWARVAPFFRVGKLGGAAGLEWPGRSVSSLGDALDLPRRFLVQSVHAETPMVAHSFICLIPIDSQ